MNRVAFSSNPGSSPAGPVSDLISQTSNAGGTGRIRVLLADDHPVVRWGLSCFMASRPGLVVVGEAVNGLEAVRKAKELLPDVVVMDIDMPELNGIEATELLRQENPSTKVILLSMHPCSTQLPRILRSGARGFLLKNARPDDILAAIGKVAEGGTCFSQDIAQQALGHLAQSLERELEIKALSDREREVLVGIAEGLSNKQLAARLGISARTIETHRGHIMQKLNIRSIAGLTRFAVSQGLVIVERAERLKS
jgi:two-component system nitrate/nitrite response regulator NarL